jgi:hypothetical protein
MSKIPVEQTKFYCMREDKVNEILSKHKNNELLHYVKELWNLIDWLNHRNDRDMKHYTALKHKTAWMLYDKPLEYYDPETRSYRIPKNPDANHSC